MLHDVIRDAELSLLSSATRHDPRQVEALLHEDFREIGRSGRLFNRATIIDSLIREPMRSTPDTSEWAFVDLPDSVLVSYALHDGSRLSRHSSVWRTGTPEPRLLFHQGTYVA
jgi:hypothetical protein